MQEKTLPNQDNSTSNIHSMDFGSIFYDIFGSPYQKSGSFLADDSLDFGYLGKPYNADTELYDYGFRDYSPEVARFTTVDPIRDGRNWFSYVVNDPVNYVDLWGLCGSDGNSKYNSEDSIWYNYTGIGCPYLEPQKESFSGKSDIVGFSLMWFGVTGSESENFITNTGTLGFSIGAPFSYGLEQSYTMERK